ncbi:MAG: T9SS type A sorting domain-containing protein [Saprospiraceae bacterium]|nr:T9SS type A sorting domain-containing protein [Saprospiraceae bacterium]
MSKFLSPFTFHLWLLLIPSFCFAQSPSGSSVCTDWGLEICRTYQGNDAQSCPDGCFRVYYHFYLVKSGTQNTGEQNPIYFSSLTLLGSLNATTSDLSTVGKILSKVNIDQTISCSPSYPGINNPGTPNSPVISYDEITNQFSYEVSATNYNAPIVSFTVPGRLLLFSLAVDVFPNETVEPNISTSITLTNSNGSNAFTCSFPITFGCTGDMEGYSTTFDQPTETCLDPDAGPVRLRIGNSINAPTTGHPNRKKVPVWVDGAADTKFDFEEFDFLLGIAPSSSMLAPYLEAGLLPTSDVEIYPVSGNQYRAYTHGGAVQIINTGSITADNTLFYIVFDGPTLESACMNAVIDFRGSYGRIAGPAFDCCKPNFGSSQTVYWDGGGDCISGECPEVKLIAAPTTNAQSSSCNNLLVFNLNATNTSVSTPTQIASLTCVLEVKKSGTFTLDATNSSSLFCTPFTNCATVTEVSSTLLRIVVDIPSFNNFLVGANYGERNFAVIALSTTTGGCIESIRFLDAVILKQGASDQCLTSTESQFTESNPADDFCTGSLSISAETEDGIAIPGWEYYLNRYTVNNSDFPNCYQQGSTSGSSVVACPCQFNKVQNVALRKVDNPLNGVSTFDLVLISRHLQGISALSGFKLLAGDANTSNSLTSFDIVELRKLILGLYNNLPSARSWRFFDKDINSSIISSSNPFLIIGPFIDYYGTPYSNFIPTANGSALYVDEEFDEFALPTTSQQDNKSNFIGFKVGDVNGNAITSVSGQSETRSTAKLHFGTKALTGKAGQRLEIPVFATERCALNAWQLALQYDTTQMVVKNIKWPTELKQGALQDRGWNIPVPGELRVLWFDAVDARTFDVGIPLFYVEVELLRNQDRGLNTLKIHPESIPSEVYAANGEPISVDLEISEIVPLVQSKIQDLDEKLVFALSVYPNPSASVFRLNIEANVAAKAHLRIQDVLGKTWFEKSLDLASGLNRIGSETLPTLPTGQYVISLHTPNGVQSLRLIRN